MSCTLMAPTKIVLKISYYYTVGMAVHDQLHMHVGCFFIA